MADSIRPYGWDETRPPKWFARAMLYGAIIFVGVLLARNALAALGDLLVMLVVAFFVSFAIEPAVDWLEAKGTKRGRATLIVFAGVTVLAALLVWLMVDLVVAQVRSLVSDAPQLIRTATDWVNHRFNANITTDSIVEQLKKYQGEVATTATDVGGRVLSVTGSVVNVVFQGFTVALFSFYLVTDGPKLRRSLCSVLPPERQRTVLSLWELAIKKTGGYIYSRLLLATLSTIVSWIVFAIIGVPSPAALALWLGLVSQFVPVIGTYIGGVLPTLIALLDTPIHALWVLIFIAVYQQIENYVFSPRITAATMEIHPAVAFGSAIAGGTLIGPIGALLALPAAAVVQAFASSFLQRHDVIDDNLVSQSRTDGPVVQREEIP